VASTLTCNSTVSVLYQLLTVSTTDAEFHTSELVGVQENVLPSKVIQLVKFEFIGAHKNVPVTVSVFPIQPTFIASTVYS